MSIPKTYTVKELSELTGLTRRTLRYYDEINLLKPAFTSENGYRNYCDGDLSRLKQILLFRSMDFSLSEIKTLIQADEADITKNLQQQLIKLEQQINLIEYKKQKILKTLNGIDRKVEDIMRKDFAHFKEEIIRENEKKYGKEIREKYGDEVVNETNHFFREKKVEDYDKLHDLNKQLNEAIKNAVIEGNPASEIAQKACLLHEQWLKGYYPNYSKEYHWGLANMYNADERFTAYYDAVYPGSAEFLKNALKIYLNM